ncbi:Hypothetical_protein [Hexamita inflata]|uniref:Hypothetical_protein n=1 Tax=Hexamita inflata TaxID=28002 RepID=A0ABP1HVZ1_9EUKA
MMKPRRLSMFSMQTQLKPNIGLIQRKQSFSQSQDLNIPLSKSQYQQEFTLLGAASFSNLNVQAIQREISSVLEIEETYQKVFSMKKEIQICNEQVQQMTQKCADLDAAASKQISYLKRLNQEMLLLM